MKSFISPQFPNPHSLSPFNKQISSIILHEELGTANLSDFLTEYAGGNYYRQAKQPTQYRRVI
jgi:hypothetical protein